jgi:hypothetical protein
MLQRARRDADVKYGSSLLGDRMPKYRAAVSSEPYDSRMGGTEASDARRPMLAFFPFGNPLLLADDTFAFSIHLGLG